MNHNMNYRRALKDKSFLLTRYKKRAIFFLLMCSGKIQ